MACKASECRSYKRHAVVTCLSPRFTVCQVSFILHSPFLLQPFFNLACCHETWFPACTDASIYCASATYTNGPRFDYWQRLFFFFFFFLAHFALLFVHISRAISTLEPRRSFVSTSTACSKVLLHQCWWC